VKAKPFKEEVSCGSSTLVFCNAKVLGRIAGREKKEET
jgi:hypothetical protein